MQIRRMISALRSRRTREYRDEEKLTAKQIQEARTARMVKAPVCNNPTPKNCQMSTRVQGEARCGGALGAIIDCPYKGPVRPFKATIDETVKQGKKKIILVEEPPEIEV